ncbi:MAG: anti-sigma factor antagonist [Clostridiales bacterium]|nr:anti-sigma factor antagonist [Clostridiales bacterium]
MGEISSKVENNKLVIFLEGRVDTNNAAEVEEKINSIISKKSGHELVLDAAKLDYISSAGLRVVLRLRKIHPEIMVINVSSEVYDIFDMTGFTEMLKVEKAFKSISIEGCDVIGQGSNGIVYRTDPETIVKVYKYPDALDDIRHEREVARRALILGIPTAISYDIVKVGDKYGSVFELLNAKSFTELIIENPDDLDKYVTIYVDVLKRIHATEASESDFPDIKKTALKWVSDIENELPEEMITKLRKMINEIPFSNTLVHGDYHTNNLMMQGDEALMIDMDTLSLGNPVFDFASIYSAYSAFSEVDHTVIEKFLGISFETGLKILNKTFELYFDPDVREINLSKAKVISYMRLLRRTIKRFPDDTAMVNHCKEMLMELVPNVHNLYY